MASWRTSAPPPSTPPKSPAMAVMSSKHSSNGSDELWTDGLLCAYEFIPGPKKHIRVGGKLDHRSGLLEGKFDADVTLKSGHFDEAAALFLKDHPPAETLGIAHFADSKAAQAARIFDGSAEAAAQSTNAIRADSSEGTGDRIAKMKMEGGYWVPIGWKRLAELVQTVQVDPDWVSSPVDESESNDEYDFLSVADVAAPYWEPAAGPTWWCNVLAGHPYIDSWLASAQWLHPAVREALRDENKLISERMKHLYYEVPVRVAGGLLCELLGQSVGDPHHNEEDVNIVLRSWQARKYLFTALHVKGTVTHLNVLGILEVQDLLAAGGVQAPKSTHEVLAHLANRLARWDYRLFRKHIFGAADEVELKFVNRRGSEDLSLLSVILNQEIRRLSTQVIRVKWSLHAREEIVFELSQHLKGDNTHKILATIRQSTRDMISEQEAVRDRLFTVQDVMQNTVRSFLQDKSIRVTHNLTVFGGCGLVLSIIVGLFGINVDGIPGAENAPYAFCIFSVCLVCLGIILVGLGFLYLGLKKPISESQLAARKLELQELVKSFQHAAETHEKVHNVAFSYAEGKEQGFPSLDDYDYVLIT